MVLILLILQSSLIRSLIKQYLNENNFRYVNDGAKSMSHDTNIQEFLIKKFKFRKAYCQLQEGRHLIF